MTTPPRLPLALPWPRTKRRPGIVQPPNPPAAPVAPVELASAPLAPSAASPAAPSDPQAWLLSLDPGQYTQQVLSDTEEANVRRYLDRNLRDHRAAYFASDKGGRTWYSIVVGAYSSYATAKAAIDELPERLQRAKPWVRRVAVIHKQMIR